MKYFSILYIQIFCFSSVLYGQQFLNGSFENVRTDCRFGLSNGGFNSYIANVRSIGNNEGAGNLSILSDKCGDINAAHGEVFIKIGIAGDPRQRDVLSIETDRPFVAGHTYSISLYIMAGNRAGLRNTLEIGMSATAELGDFGTKVHSIKGSTDDWQEMHFQFVAPVTGRFLTIKLKRGNNAAIFVDNFNISCPTSLNLGPDTTFCIVKDVIIRPEGWFENFRWQDNSNESYFIVNQPGTYFVEATRDNCILSDTIVLQEYPQQCNCRIFIPNIFTPNEDGINDEIYPLTDCTFTDYHFTIFNNWGGIVFESIDPKLVWDGKDNTVYFPTGKYIYKLNYKFEYQTEQQMQAGSIQLIR